MRRGYYRIPKNNPANRIAGPLSDAVIAKYNEGWSKSRIAREFRLNRRTVIRICGSPNRPSELPPPNLEPASSPTVRCIGCGITIRRSVLRAHWPNCPGVREGHFSVNNCPV
jgi:hypothetical protein